MFVFQPSFKHISCIEVISVVSYGVDNKLWFEYYTECCKVAKMLVWGGFPLSILPTLCKTGRTPCQVVSYEIFCGKSVIGPGLYISFFRFPLIIIILSLLKTDPSLQPEMCNGHWSGSTYHSHSMWASFLTQHMTIVCLNKAR